MIGGGSRKAARYLAMRRARRIRNAVNRTLTPAAERSGLCKGEYPWSAVIAEAFFVNCACCIFWRGFLAGLTLPILGALTWLVVT